MPLRRHAAPLRTGTRIRPYNSKPHRANGDHSTPASTSRLTPSHEHSRDVTASPSPSKNGRATLGDLLSSTHTLRTSKDAIRVVELLDSSDSDSPVAKTANARNEADEHGLDDVVTPELPPADEAAPALPARLEELATASQMPTLEVVIDNSVGIDHTDMQPNLAPADTKVFSPEPPPDPLADQRPMFDAKELEMQPLYDELKLLLETEQPSDGEDDDEDYEERRLRKLRANEVLLAQLGLAGAGKNSNAADSVICDQESDHTHDDDDEPMPRNDALARGRGRPRKRARIDTARPSEDGRENRSSKKKYDRRVKFADDGTTKSAPLRGETFDLAYLDLPVLRDRARNDYIFIRDVPEITPEDLATWSEDEEDEDDVLDAAHEFGVDSDDTAFRGYDSLGRIKTKRNKRQPDVLPDGTVMTSCHQCRRKTPGPKMRCCRMRKGIQCALMYCERCITVRYGEKFDHNDQNFHCPRCLGYCNCSCCLRRSGFGDLVDRGREHVLAFSDELKKLAGQGGFEGIQGRISAILAESKAHQMDTPPPRPRKSNGRAARRGAEVTNTPTFGPPRRRGRPAKVRDAWTPIIAQLDLSEEVADGEVLSPMEEYALGRLAVCRRVLKLQATNQLEKPKARLVVKLKRPQHKSPVVKDPAKAVAVVEKRKVPNYHDMEKDVWVRSAADYQTSESEAEDLSEHGTDDEKEEASAEIAFEEGRTQTFAASLMRRHGSSSIVDSRDSSPLTNSDDDLSTSFIASSQLKEDGDVSHTIDYAEEPDTTMQSPTAAMYTHASLGMPQDMRQLALAVLEEHDEPIKAAHDDLLRSQESPVFPPFSGSEAGQLNALLEPDPLAGTPVLFAHAAYPDP